MKKVTINIKAKFGSKFQEQFAGDSLLGMIKAWETYVRNAHKKNEVEALIDDSPALHLVWFEWKK